MKDTFYFSHDYNSRTDDKIKRLIRKHGMLGYGLFWAIIEDLYNNANALRTDYEGIAYELRTDERVIESIVTDFDLFVINDDIFGSLSVQRRLEERNVKSIKAKESAFKRWNKDANALPTQSECNAIKERKGKERKEVKNKYIYSEFYDSEIEKSKNNDEYVKFVKVLFGENNLKQPLRNVLKLKNQLTFAQFPLVMQKKKEYNCSITSILENMENKPTLTKDYSSLQRTLLNWMKPKELRK